MKKFFLKQSFIVFSLLLILVNDTYGSEEIKESDLCAKSAVLIDGDTGRILYEKSGNDRKAMASTTKIMTCIVALETGSLNKKVVISKRAASMPKVHMNSKVGEKYILKDLLYAMMLESYNDTAVAVAEGVSGSVEGFAKLMNAKAREIGAKNTNFVTPNGLDADKHYSTAYDMALIGAYAINNKEFVKIINTKNYQFTDCSGKRTISVYNRNGFLSMYNGALGIKTGFTSKAGYCFVGAVKNKNRTFVTCVLACGWPPNKEYKWKDTKILMDYGNMNYTKKKIKNIDNTIKVKIYNGTKKTIDAKIINKKNYLASDTEKIDVKTKFDYKLPIYKNDVIGNADIFIGGKMVNSCKILAKDTVLEYNFKYCLNKVINCFIL